MTPPECWSVAPCLLVDDVVATAKAGRMRPNHRVDPEQTVWDAYVGVDDAGHDLGTR
jgi:hypothetical protein